MSLNLIYSSPSSAPRPPRSRRCCPSQSNQPHLVGCSMRILGLMAALRTANKTAVVLLIALIELTHQRDVQGKADTVVRPMTNVMNRLAAKKDEEDQPEPHPQNADVGLTVQAPVDSEFWRPRSASRGHPYARGVLHRRCLDGRDRRTRRGAGTGWAHELGHRGRRDGRA